MSVSTGLEQILIFDPDDWIHAGVFALEADELASAPGSNRTQIQHLEDLLRELLEGQYGLVGSITSDRFCAWPGTIDEIIDRAVLAWKNSDEINEQYCFWVELSDLGYSVAKERENRA